MENYWEKKIFDINRPTHSSMSSNPTMQNLLMSSHTSANSGHLMKDIEKSYFMNQPKKSMANIWREPYVEIFNAPNSKDGHGPHLLPLARIKKVMKSNEEVKMISAETPVVFSKACELLIMELSLRSWIHTEKNNRRTVQRCDVAKAIRDDKTLEFLEDTVPMEFEQVMVDEIGVQDPFLEVDTTSPDVVYTDQGQENHPREATSSPFDYSTAMKNLNVAVLNRDQEMVDGSAPPPVVGDIKFPWI